MITMILTPQRSDMTVAYSVDGDVLNVIGASGEDYFDFSSLIDGDIAADFVSTLSVCPVLSAECSVYDSERLITVSAIGWYAADAEEDAKQMREVIL